MLQKWLYTYIDNIIRIWIFTRNAVRRIICRRIFANQQKFNNERNNSNFDSNCNLFVSLSTHYNIFGDRLFEVTN